MNQTETIQALQNGAFDETLTQLYACTGEALQPFRRRYADAIAAFGKTFGTDGDILLFSAPGRTELCGNHTDHQGGHVLAGSVNLDIIAVAAVRDSGQIRLQSEGFAPDTVSLDDLTPRQAEVNTSAAPLRSPGRYGSFPEDGWQLRTGQPHRPFPNLLRGSSRIRRPPPDDGRR